MPEIAGATTFPGTTLPAAYTTDHRSGGAHAVNNGLTVSNTAATGSLGCVRQAAAVAVADGDTATFRIASSGDFRGVLALRQGAGDAVFCPGVYIAGGVWAACYWTIGNGLLPRGSAGPSIASAPWVRFRRSGTSCVVETAPDVAGAPGTWTVLHTHLAADGLWTPAWATTQRELMSQGVGGGGAGSATFVQAGLAAAPTADAFRLLPPWRDAIRIPRGVVLSPPLQVEAIVAATGARDATFTGPVTLEIPVGDAGRIASGTATQAASAGVATFPDLIFGE